LKVRFNYIYHISPSHNNSIVRNFTEEELNASLPSKYDVIGYNDSIDYLSQVPDNNYTFKNRYFIYSDYYIILDLFRHHSKTDSSSFFSNEFDVLYYIYSNESYWIGNNLLKYEFHILFLNYPDGNIKIFSYAESHPPQRYGGIENRDDPNYKKHKATLLEKAEYDYTTVCNIILTIEINITNQFVT